MSNQFDINGERIARDWAKVVGIDLTEDQLANLASAIAKNLAMSAVSSALDSAYLDRAKDYLKEKHSEAG